MWLVVGCNPLDPDRLPSKEGTNPLAGCLQCHVDVEVEHLWSKHHSVSNMGCIECHGPSEGHLADENNEVKPDQAFARKDVDRLCSTCHKCSRKMPRGWTKTPPEKLAVCTECHAAHRFAMRSGK
ncbi:MAG: multiheme c-type cytochrome [Planctomycetota bacterium]